MLKKRNSSQSYLLLFVIGLLCALFALSIQQWVVDQAPATASAQIQRALKNAASSGRYQYQTELLQTLHPTMRLENVGRTTRTTRAVMAGEMDRRNETMRFQLSVANQPPLEVKIEAGTAFGRLAADQPWTEVPLATDLFAPGGDPLAFLTTAQNVRIITPAQPASDQEANDALANRGATAPSAAGSAEGGNTFFPSELLPATLTASITRYQFELDGLKYAQLMRQEMESYLREQGELPAGITLGLADKYVKMQGQGEIWVSRDANGNELPMRQMLRLSFPPAAGATEWVEAEIVTTYSAWQGQLANGIAFDLRQPATILASALHMSGITPQAAQQMGFTFSLVLIVLGLLALSLTYRHTLPMRVAVYGLVILSMVVAPLLQTQRVSAFYDAQAERRHQVEAIQASNATDLAMATQPLNAHAAPMAQPQLAAQHAQLADMQVATRSAQLASPCVITASSDCDGDGLTDNVEIYELGTDIEKIDTDGDGISDAREVKPFQWFGTWYLDPLQADTNGDGIDDGEECFTRVDFDSTNLVAIDDVPCLDRDLDEIPDVFDFDNDGDGVLDAVDISPNDAQVVEDNERFQLDLEGVQTEKNLLVDLQLRPMDDTHLSWTNSVLDWRDNDNQGQIQRMTPNALGNGAGDIQLMPMLEISIPYSATNPAAGLPVNGTPTITATTPISTWLDTSLTSQYAMNVWLGKDGVRNVAVPLMLVTDPTGGAPLAWQARIPYRLQNGITDWGAAHEMRVVWYVQGQVDSCTPPAGAAADYCTKAENWVSGKTVLQTYPETFRITGLSVTEQHDTTAFLAGQAISGNSPAYPDQIWHLADVLQQSWLRGDSVNGSRFPLTDVSATLSDWGINGLSTRTITNLSDEVALLQALNLETARSFIKSDLYPTDPATGKTTTVLLAGEESGRSAFLGGVDQVDINSTPTLVNRTSYTNTVLTVDLTGASVTTQGILRWQPYRFDGVGWQTADLGNFLTQLESALSSVFTQAKLQEYGLLDGVEPSDAFADAQAGAVFLAQSFYMATMAGVNTVVGSGSVPGPASVPLDNSLYADVGDPALAIVQTMVGKVQNVYTVLNRSSLDIPTVDANIESKAVSAWQRLAQSTAAVLAAYGQVAGGAASSVTSQALAEMSKSAQMSLESDTFVHLYDSGLIFATAGTQAMTAQTGAGGRLANVIGVVWSVGSPAMAAYSHLWYTKMANLTQLRSALMVSSAGRQVLSNIQTLEASVRELKGTISQLSDEAAAFADSGAFKNFNYKQNARSAVSYYFQDGRSVEAVAAEGAGFKWLNDPDWNPDLRVKYEQLNAKVVNTKLYRNQLIGILDGEKARLQSSFGVSLDQVVPEAAQKIKRTAAKWAVIGVATSVATAGLTIGATLANGQIDPDSPAFAQLLATQISSVIIDTFIAVLDVLVVVANFARLGTALAILAVIDFVIAVVCAATKFDETNPEAAAWICGGFAGALAKALSLVIGDVTPLVDLTNPNRMQVEFYPPALGNESGVDGIVAGNSITFSGSITNTLYLGNPSWKSALWRGQWSDDNLDDATFAYRFQTDETEVNVDLNGTTWQPYPGRREALYVNDPRLPGYGCQVVPLRS
ncbi:MAG TPA: hypothetical protein P5121_28035, partial [Caldilineaceae bacterium]|nr:hypothetical protein [Caldilineaceae bacterium]